MKKMFAILLAAMMLCALALPALGEGAENTLAVNGTATVSLAADTATLTIGARTLNASVGEAQRENAAIMNAVIEAILAQGVAKEDIVTSEFSVYENYDYSDTGAEMKQYAVSNMLYVTVRALDTTAAIIDAATQNGANQMYGLNFTSSQSTEAYKKALARAVEDAQAKAEALAAATGKTLGAVIAINAAGSDYYGGAYGVANSMEMMNAKDAGAAIVTGDVSVSATITVTYAID